MADPKDAKLSIVVSTVDQATAKLKAINDRLDAVTKPMRDFKSALSDLREKSGLNDVIDGFKGVGSAIGDMLGKVAMIGGVVGVATAGLLALVGQFDELGDKAEAVGLSVDALAQLRYAAQKSGASVEQLDGGMQAFSKSLGQARAGTGRMAGFLEKVSPVLLKQLKATKNNEEAFSLLSDAMAKLEDPAKKAALAAATVGDPALAPLLARGAAGIQELRDKHLLLAGSQKDAADAAGQADDALVDLHAATDGAKAALVQGLAPALTVIVKKMSEWLAGHRDDIKRWATDIGEKLPGAIQRVVEWVGKAYDKVAAFIDKIGGLKTVAIALGAALVAGPVASLVTLGSSLVKMGSRIAALSGEFSAAASTATGFGGTLSRLVAAGGPIALALGGAYALSELTGGAIGEGKGGALGLAQGMLDVRSGKAPAAFDAIVGQAMGAFNAARGDVSGQARGAIDGARSSSTTDAKVTIDIANAPRGTRVRTDPQSTADVDLSVGYQMAGAM